MTTTVFHGGRVFTSDAAGTIASAVAVADGKIAAVGGRRAVEPFLRTADEVVELHGGLLLPGFGDAHVHPVLGGLERIRCDLTGATTAGAYARIIGDYARAHPGAEWILGGGWSMAAFPGGRPHRDALDAVVGDRPALLPNRDHHSTWVSTAALARAGIDRHTPDPPDGRIERDADGEPTGLLHEGAADLVARVAPPDSQEDFAAALAEAQRYLHSYGITNWQDAWVVAPGTAGSVPSAHEAYLRADRTGTLTARVTGALWWDRSCPPDGVADQVAHLAAVRAATGGRNYRTPAVKVMQDGVVETFTAAVLEPYLDRHGHPTGERGIGFLDRELLREVTIALDAAGFHIHYHAIGDRGVRDVLDALEAASAKGPSGLRHQIAHLQLVHPEDLPRLHHLGVTANLQALWAAHEPQMDELTLPFLGRPRADRQYPFGDLLRTGAALAMGSDWPVSTPDPLAAIHVAVTRVLPGARTPALGPDQTLPLATALRAYTAGSAAVNHVADIAGSISPGRAADLVVLDHDPFTGPPHEIGSARVVRTYVAGAEVYRGQARVVR